MRNNRKKANRKKTRTYMRAYFLFAFRKRLRYVCVFSNPA